VGEQVTEPAWVCPYCHRDCVAEAERLTELEQLVKANERLAEQVLAERAQARTDLTMLRDERDELRAELERQQHSIDNIAQANVELSAENERLRAELHRVTESRRAQRERVQELHAALSEMLESFTEPEDDNDILRRARAALARS
jgi:septal ring factor EnvC (AmiA/AmiB activator)